MAMEFYFDLEDLSKGIIAFDKKADMAVKMYANVKAKDLESYSKDKAPWTDRTGTARKTLNGSVSKIENGYRITLSHGVDYGMWLELAHEKRFAIVRPALELKAPEIFEGFSGLLAKMGY